MSLPTPQPPLQPPLQPLPQPSLQPLPQPSLQPLPQLPLQPQPASSNKYKYIILIIIVIIIITIIGIVVYFLTKKKSNNTSEINKSITLPTNINEQSTISTTKSNLPETYITTSNLPETYITTSNLPETYITTSVTRSNLTEPIVTTSNLNNPTTTSDYFISFNTDVKSPITTPITTPAPIIRPQLTTSAPIITTPSINLNTTDINKKLLIVKYNSLYYTYIIRSNGLYVCQNTSCSKLSSLMFKHIFKVTTKIYGITVDNLLYFWEGNSTPVLFNNDTWEYGDGQTIQTFPNAGPDKYTLGWWGKKTNNLMYINNLNSPGIMFNTDNDWKVIRSVYNSFIGIKNDGSVYAWGYVHYYWEFGWKDYVELPTKINFYPTELNVKFKDVIIGTSGLINNHPTKIGNIDGLDTTKVIMYDLIVYLIAEDNTVYYALSSNNHFQITANASSSQNIINTTPLDTKYIKMNIISLGYTSILNKLYYYNVEDYLSVTYGLTPNGILYYWIIAANGKTKVNKPNQIIIDFDLCDSNTDQNIPSKENIVIYQDSTDKFFLKINDSMPQELFFS